MSARRVSVAFTPRSRQDFEDILLYSGKTWGEQQLREYENQLDQSILLLQSHPEVGKSVLGILSDYRALRSGHHIIYYTYAGNQLTIHRILHERRHVISDLLMPEDD
jgi:plasmid stabilization system protein ParE